MILVTVNFSLSPDLVSGRFNQLLVLLIPWQQVVTHGSGDEVKDSSLKGILLAAGVAPW